MPKRKVDSKEIGLVAGLRFMNHFFKTDYLHYGYWADELPVEMANLKQAQQEYSKKLFEFIPPGTSHILDVGCGSGRVAFELLEMGHEVDCISPSAKLTEFAAELLGQRVRIFRGRLEELQLERKYDMVLFSESFQYIEMSDAFSKSLSCLAPGGSIVVSDFFRNDGVEGKSPLGGGHSLMEFRELLSRFDLQVMREENITDRVAPTIDLVNGITMEVVEPLYRDLIALFRNRFPLLAKLVLWKYRKKLAKIENKHFKGERSGANFRKFKTYLMLVLKPRSMSQA